MKKKKLINGSIILFARGAPQRSQLLQLPSVHSCITSTAQAARAHAEDSLSFSLRIGPAGSLLPFSAAYGHVLLCLFSAPLRSKKCLTHTESRKYSNTGEQTHEPETPPAFPSLPSKNGIE